MEEAEDTEARTGVASGMGMPTERGSVPAEKIDVVKSCHVLPSSSALELERALQRVATGAGEVWIHKILEGGVSRVYITFAIIQGVCFILFY